MKAETGRCRICRTSLQPRAETCLSCGAVLDPSKAPLPKNSQRIDSALKRSVSVGLLVLMFITDGVISLFLAVLSVGAGPTIFYIFLGTNVVCWIGAVYCFASRRLAWCYAFAMLPVPGAILVIYAILGIQRVI